MAIFVSILQGMIVVLFRVLILDEYLTYFKWYRKSMGGFWVYSKAIGWLPYSDAGAEHQISLAEKYPGLCRNGKDIEDYR